VPWSNSVSLSNLPKLDLDILFIASGGARPNYGNERLELASTSELISCFNIPEKTKIIYISSGAVYGECIRNQKEEDIPMPTTTYGKSKLKAEEQLQLIFGRQLYALRVGNVVDPNNPYGLFAFLSRAFSNNRIEFSGNPTDCRDYIAVSDFLNSLEILVTLQEPPNILNIGSGKSLTLWQIASLLETISESRVSISWGARRSGDLSKSMLDTNRMIEVLGFYPSDPLKLIGDFSRSLV
jgi:UDP-glucose 4-epimerase